MAGFCMRAVGNRLTFLRGGATICGKRKGDHYVRLYARLFDLQQQLLLA